jgi:glycosyltransferase involved in cell wall biosynthesis
MGIRTILLLDEPPHDDDFIPRSKYKRVILPAPVSPDQFLLRAKELQIAVQKYGIDLIVHHKHMERSCFWDGLVFKAIGIPCALHTHGSFATFLQIGFLDRFLSLTSYYKPFDVVIALSRVDALYWSAYHKNVIVMPNPLPEVTDDDSGVDVEKDDRAPGELLFAGRLVSENNYFDLLEIIDSIKDECPDVHLTICGKTQFPNDRVFAVFKRGISDRGLDPYITLAGFQKDMEPYYRKAQILLFLSDIGGWPMTLFEALSCATPAVCYDLPWLELMRKGKGILKANHGDKEDVAKKTALLLKDDKLREKLGIDAKQSIKDFQALDYGRLWQEVFRVCSGLNTEIATSWCTTPSEPWGRIFDLTDGGCRETHELMVKTMKMSLKMYLNKTACEEFTQLPSWLESSSSL